MKRTPLLLFILITVASVCLAACGSARTTTEKIEPATVKDIEGSELKLIILTEKAAERIGVETVPASPTLVPYSAVIFDVEGNTWVYTNPEPLTYLRVPVVIDQIEGDQAFLSRKLGTEAPVVTVGVAQLYGAETGVSK